MSKDLKTAVYSSLDELYDKCNRLMQQDESIRKYASSFMHSLMGDITELKEDIQSGSVYVDESTLDRIIEINNKAIFGKLT